MLPPHELKNKNFSHALRGYSAAEVDDYIEFLLERYSDVYRRNDQLEKELRLANVRLEELTAKEDAINRALVNAQRLEEKIISDANEQAEIITRAAKTNADKILNDFHRKVGKERQTLHELRNMVALFKNTVLEQYIEHIKAIKLIAPELDSEPEWDTTEAEYTEQVLDGIRNAVASAAENSEKKNKLEDILQAHTVENTADDLSDNNSRDAYVPAEDNKLENVSSAEADSADEVKEEIIIIPKTSLKRRPRARRTVEKNIEPPVQNPIPSSPGEEDSDTEEALDRLFNDSGK